MADGSASGGSLASRTHSQESWDVLSNNASMSPSSSFPGVDYSQLDYQQADADYTNGYSPIDAASTAPSTLDAPYGFPPGLYTLIQDAGDGIYWRLNASYRANSDFPQTIMVEPRYLQPPHPLTLPPHPTNPPPSSNRKNQFVCLWHLDDTPCLSKGKFIRKADLQRHYDTVHRSDQTTFDCPRPNCSRKGVNGFSRKDHMIEHLRMYHGQNVEKRVGGGGKSGRRRSDE